MGRYYAGYLLCWLPAAVFTVLLRNEKVFALLSAWTSSATLISFGIQVFCAVFMLLGWMAVSYFAAYRFPSRTLSSILIYFGVNMLIIMGYYASFYGSPLYRFLRYYGGIFSYVPMNVGIQAFIDYNVSHEIWATGIIAGICFIGFLAGALRRRVSPNPYRPRMSGGTG